MDAVNNLYNAILKGNLKDSIEITTNSLNENISPDVIINEYMVKAMEEIGARFERGEAFVPELLMSARAMKGALDILKPLLVKNSNSIQGKVVIGTVKGDLHDIGKNLVASMLEGCGFEVINIGTDASVDKFVNTAIEVNADIICMSALLTTTMNYMSEIIEELNKRGLKGKIKVMIGGAPVNEKFANQIGADGYSDNANSAVILAKKLLNS